MDRPLEIVIVEDNEILREEMAAFLTRTDWRVRGVANGRLLDEALRQRPCDVVVLDLNLPGEDGISIARRLRDARPELGIVMLTARNSQPDRALGYGSGADVYLTKPAHVGELESVIYNLARRLPHASDSAGHGMVLNVPHMLLQGADQRQAKLTVNEFKLLSRLAVAPERELSAKMLLHLIGSEPGAEADERQRLTVLLSRLRTKLNQELDAPELIKSVRGKGYRLSIPLVLKE